MSRHLFPTPLRAIALLLAVSLLIQDAVWAGAAAAPATAPVAPSAGTAAFDLPRRLGEVTRQGQGSGAETVINIQDAHNQMGAQYGIASILEELTQRYGLGMVALEGAGGRVDTSVVSSFPNSEARKKTGEFLLKNGQISAGEYFSIVSDSKNKVALYGAEQEALYRRNLQVFRIVAGRQARLAEPMAAADAHLRKMERNVFSRPLRVFRAQARQWAAHADYSKKAWNRLAASAAPSGILPEGFGEIRKWRRTAGLEGRIGFSEAAQEREMLFRVLAQTLDAPRARHLAWKTLQYRRGKVSAAEFHGFLIRTARSAGIRMSRYPQLALYARYVFLYERIRLAELIDQIAEWQEGVENRLARTEDEKALLDASRQFALIQKLLGLKLSHPEYVRVQGWFRDNAASRWIKTVRRLDADAALPLTADDERRLARALPDARHFYQLAIRRDRILLENTLKKMRQDGVRTAALVTGGFHSEGLSQLMREGQVSHLVIMPKFDPKEGERPYVTLLTRRPSQVREMLDGKRFTLSAPMDLFSAPRLAQESNLRRMVALLAVSARMAGVNPADPARQAEYLKNYSAAWKRAGQTGVAPEKLAEALADMRSARPTRDGNSYEVRFDDGEVLEMPVDRRQKVVQDILHAETVRAEDVRTPFKPAAPAPNWDKPVTPLPIVKPAPAPTPAAPARMAAAAKPLVLSTVPDQGVEAFLDNTPAARPAARTSFAPILRRVLPEAAVVAAGGLVYGAALLSPTGLGMVFLASVAIRFARAASFLTHGLGHAAAKAGTDRDAGAWAPAQIAEGVPYRRIWQSVLPLMPSFGDALPGGVPSIEAGQSEPWKIRIKALGGIAFNLAAAGMSFFALREIGAPDDVQSSLPILKAFVAGLFLWNTRDALTSWSDIAAFFSGIASQFNCGNFGIMMWRRREDGNRLLPERMRTIVGRMGEETEVRGGQAGGILLKGVNSKGQTVFVGTKLVNSKRGSLVTSLENAFDAEVATAESKGVRPMSASKFKKVHPLIGPAGDDGDWITPPGQRIRPEENAVTTVTGHYRYGTSSKPSVVETHWHEWTPEQQVWQWAYTDGSWSKQEKTASSRVQYYSQKMKKSGANRITHNGDFDAWTLFGHDIENPSELGEWLAKVLNQPNMTLGDSPKIAGMIDLLFTQGMWDRSVRWAFQAAVAGSVDAATLTPDEIANLASVFEAMFQQSKDQIMSQNAEGVSDISPQAMEDLALAMALKLQNQTVARGWTAEQRLSFARTTVQSFFKNDMEEATKIFMSKAKGVFGLVVTSTLEDGYNVIVSKGQTMEIGFDPNNFVAYASEPYAVQAALQEAGGDEAFRISLKSRDGEVARVSPDRIRIFNMAKGRYLTREEILSEDRMVDLKDNPYLKQEETTFFPDDPVGSDLVDPARIWSRVRRDWEDPQSWNRQTADHLLELLTERARLMAEDKETMRGKLNLDYGRKTPDLLFIGVENNLWIYEQYAQVLRNLFPELKIEAVSANKVIHSPGSLIGPETIAWIGSYSAQTSPPLATAGLLEEAKEIPVSEAEYYSMVADIHNKKMLREVFIQTGEWESAMGRAIGQKYMSYSKFSRRIFCSLGGRRYSEPATATAAATQATMTCFALYAARRMRELEAAGEVPANPFGMRATLRDIEALSQDRDLMIDQSIPLITGYDAAGEIKPSRPYDRLVESGIAWGKHIREPFISWAISKVYQFVTIVILEAPFGALGAAVGHWLDMPTTGVAAYFFTRFFRLGDFIVYGWSDWFASLGQRWWQMRDMLARTGKRDILIYDVPYVHQILQIYVSKLFSLSYGIASISVHGATPTDHGLHRFGHRVVRGLLVSLGIANGKTTDAARENQAAAFMAGSQTMGVANLDTSAEVVTISNDPSVGQRNFNSFNLLPTRPLKAVVDNADLVHGLREEMFDSYERLLAGHVKFWAMAKYVSNTPFIRYRMDRSQSRARVHTTPSPRQAPGTIQEFVRRFSRKPAQETVIDLTAEMVYLEPTEEGLIATFQDDKGMWTQTFRPRGRKWATADGEYTAHIDRQNGEPMFKISHRKKKEAPIAFPLSGKMLEWMEQEASVAGARLAAPGFGQLFRRAVLAVIVSFPLIPAAPARAQNTDFVQAYLALPPDQRQLVDEAIQRMADESEAAAKSLNQAAQSVAAPRIPDSAPVPVPPVYVDPNSNPGSPAPNPLDNRPWFSGEKPTVPGQNQPPVKAGDLTAAQFLNRYVGQAKGQNPANRMRAILASAARPSVPSNAASQVRSPMYSVQPASGDTGLTPDDTPATAGADASDPESDESPSAGSDRGIWKWVPSWYYLTHAGAVITLMGAAVALHYAFWHKFLPFLGNLKKAREAAAATIVIAGIALAVFPPATTVALWTIAVSAVYLTGSLIIPSMREHPKAAAAVVLTASVIAALYPPARIWAFGAAGVAAVYLTHVYAGFWIQKYRRRIFWMSLVGWMVYSGVWFRQNPGRWQDLKQRIGDAKQLMAPQNPTTVTTTAAAETETRTESTTESGKTSTVVSASVEPSAMPAVSAPRPFVPDPALLSRIQQASQNRTQAETANRAAQQAIETSSASGATAELPSSVEAQNAAGVWAALSDEDIRRGISTQNGQVVYLPSGDANGAKEPVRFGGAEGVERVQAVFLARAQKLLDAEWQRLAPYEERSRAFAKNLESRIPAIRDSDPRMVPFVEGYLRSFQPPYTFLYHRPDPQTAQWYVNEPYRLANRRMTGDLMDLQNLRPIQDWPFRQLESMGVKMGVGGSYILPFEGGSVSVVPDTLTFIEDGVLYMARIGSKPVATLAAWPDLTSALDRAKADAVASQTQRTQKKETDRKALEAAAQRSREALDAADRELKRLQGELDQSRKSWEAAAPAAARMAEIRPFWLRLFASIASVVALFQTGRYFFEKEVSKPKPFAEWKLNERKESSGLWTPKPQKIQFRATYVLPPDRMAAGPVTQAPGLTGGNPDQEPSAQELEQREKEWADLWSSDPQMKSLWITLNAIQAEELAALNMEINAGFRSSTGWMPGGLEDQRLRTNNVTARQDVMFYDLMKILKAARESRKQGTQVQERMNVLFYLVQIPSISTVNKVKLIRHVVKYFPGDSRAIDPLKDLYLSLDESFPQSKLSNREVLNEYILLRTEILNAWKASGIDLVGGPLQTMRNKYISSANAEGHALKGRTLLALEFLLQDMGLAQRALYVPSVPSDFPDIASTPTFQYPVPEHDLARGVIARELAADPEMGILPVADLPEAEYGRIRSVLSRPYGPEWDRLLIDTDERVRANAILYVGLSGDPLLMRLVEDGFYDEHPLVRGAAAVAASWYRLADNPNAPDPKLLGLLNVINHYGSNENDNLTSRGLAILALPTLASEEKALSLLRLILVSGGEDVAPDARVWDQPEEQEAYKALAKSLKAHHGESEANKVRAIMALCAMPNRDAALGVLLEVHASYRQEVTSYNQFWLYSDQAPVNERIREAIRLLAAGPGKIPPALHHAFERAVIEKRQGDALFVYLDAMRRRDKTAHQQFIQEHSNQIQTLITELFFKDTWKFFLGLWAILFVGYQAGMLTSLKQAIFRSGGGFVNRRIVKRPKPEMVRVQRADETAAPPRTHVVKRLVEQTLRAVAALKGQNGNGTNGSHSGSDASNVTHNGDSNGHGGARLAASKAPAPVRVQKQEEPLVPATVVPASLPVPKLKLGFQLEKGQSRETASAQWKKALESGRIRPELAGRIDVSYIDAAEWASPETKALDGLDLILDSSSLDQPEIAPMLFRTFSEADRKSLEPVVPLIERLLTGEQGEMSKSQTAALLRFLEQSIADPAPKQLVSVNGQLLLLPEVPPGSTSVASAEIPAAVGRALDERLAAVFLSEEKDPVGTLKKFVADVVKPYLLGGITGVPGSSVAERAQRLAAALPKNGRAFYATADPSYLYPLNASGNSDDQVFTDLSVFNQDDMGRPFSYRLDRAQRLDPKKQLLLVRDPKITRQTLNKIAADWFQNNVIFAPNAKTIADVQSSADYKRLVRAGVIQPQAASVYLTLESDALGALRVDEASQALDNWVLMVSKDCDTTVMALEFGIGLLNKRGQTGSITLGLSRIGGNMFRFNNLELRGTNERLARYRLAARMAAESV